MSSLVSVLITAYNAEYWIAQTLDSVLAQTWPHIEVVVIDDGSRDNTLAVARRFESGRVKVITQDNHGQAAAENRAIQEAQGQFIQFLDADDLLSPDKIQRQVHLLNECGSDYLTSCAWARFYKSSDEAKFIPQSLWRDLAPVDWLVQAWEGNLMMHGASYLVPRLIVERAGPWDERLSLINDFDYFSRVHLASKGIKFCPGPRTYYRSGNPSLSGHKSDAAWASAFLAMELGTASLLKTEDSPRTRHACATTFQRFIYDVYPDVPELRRRATEKVREFGGTDLRPSGGAVFRRLTRVLGWKAARRLQNYAYRRGYAEVVRSRAQSEAVN